MQLRFLAVTIMTISAMGFTACSSNYKVSKEQPTDTSVAVVTPNKQSGDVHHPKWSYTGHTGPESWGDVEGASACKIGKAQSPINITKVTASSVSAPTINYSQSTDVRIHDNGHTVVYTPTTNDNTLRLNNDTYVLKQFHYHTPSEHQFGGQNYPGEIHFVHANSEGNLAVVGVMLEIGQANEVLRILLNGTQLTVANDDEFTAHKVDLSALAPAAPTFYHYSGSLTTPPCSEKVQWYFSKQPLALASDQFAIMFDLYDGNSRPVQPQGSRTVQQLSH